MEAITFERPSLRKSLRTELLQMLYRGALRPDEAIREVRLASRLGVSRTPLREALIGLEREGFVVSRPGVGFTVAPLTEEDARHTYELAGALEASGLASVLPLEPEERDTLRTINRKLLEGREDVEASIANDAAWHETLTRRFENSRLTTMLTLIRRHVRRYELSFMADPDRVASSFEGHEDILHLCVEERVAEAQAALREHWERGIAAFVDG